MGILELTRILNPDFMSRPGLIFAPGYRWVGYRLEGPMARHGWGWA